MSGAVSNNILAYADDSAILVVDKSVPNMGTILQNELEISKLTTKKLSVMSLV